MKQQANNLTESLQNMEIGGNTYDMTDSTSIVDPIQTQQDFNTNNIAQTTQKTNSLFDMLKNAGGMNFGGMGGFGNNQGGAWGNVMSGFKMGSGMRTGLGNLKNKFPNIFGG